MTDKETLKAACAHLGVSETAVLSYRVYEEHIALVVDRGIAGCPKYTISLADLVQPEAVEDEPRPAARPKRSRT